MSIKILNVFPGSPAARAGIRSGDSIVRMNGEDVIDEIDYQALCAFSRVQIELISENGKPYKCTIIKNDWEPLGVTLDEMTQLKPRQCRNHCQFCFIDQMPPGLRKTLYVKDDDWRLSLMMGNYITMTNISDSEFTRILVRRASPLFISVHATDPAVRRNLMKNPNAEKLMDRLTQLKAHGLQFHAQIVLCPGLNDGEILKKSIRDLRSLFPSALSMAVVPVGLTRYRDGLSGLKQFDCRMAEETLDLIESFQKQYLEEIGTRFVFASDEFYCITGRPIPPDPVYEDYPQIENGVGMLRLLDQECREASEYIVPPDYRQRKILIATGASAKPFIQELADRYSPKGTTVEVRAVKNAFFGETITVTGLIVGQDLISGVLDADCDEILISYSMLRENSDCFLDDMTFAQVQKAVQKPIRVVRNTGESFLKALYGLEEEP